MAKKDKQKREPKKPKKPRGVNKTTTRGWLETRGRA